MTDFFGYLGLTLFLMGIPIGLLQLCGAPRRALAWCMLISLISCLVPWTGSSLVYFVRGVLGDLSIATLVFIMTMYARMLLVSANRHKPVAVSAAWLILALLIPLYASTLGYWEYDLYAWGYEPQWLLVAAGLLLVWAWQMQPVLAIAWFIGVVSFAADWTPSRNLWDALFDPFMAGGAAWVAGRAVILAFLSKRQERTEHQQPHLFSKAA